MKNMNTTEETSPHFTNSWMMQDHGAPNHHPETTFSMKKEPKRYESSEPFFPFKTEMNKSPPPKKPI